MTEQKKWELSEDFDVQQREFIIGCIFLTLGLAFLRGTTKMFATKWNER